MDIFDNEGVLDVYCPACDLGVSLNIDVREFSNGLPPQITPQTKNEISDNEVKKISSTLEHHKGGMKDLFKPQ